jgi:hypothetical protein
LRDLFVRISNLNLESKKKSDKNNGEREQEVGGVGCGSLGNERHQFRWYYHGQ